MKVIRHLLRKNEKKQYSNSIHNEDLIDIPVYGPHDNILPVPYEVSGFFVEFEACFETRCRDFLSKTNLDKYNKDYMDELVDHMQDEAIGLLDVQGIGHRNAINQLARTRLSDINDV